MKRRRILMVSGSAPPVRDGVGDCTDRLICELARQRPDWAWYWLCRRPRWFHAPVVRRDGFTLLRPSHTWSPRGVRLVRAVARGLRPDLVHVQEQIHSFFETDAACRVADVATAAGVPLVTTLHEYHTELASVRFTSELVRRSAAVIANDPRNAERCLAETGRAPNQRWWSGGTVRPLDPGSRPATVPGRFTTFGFISGLKSLGVVGEALRSVRAGSPEVHWKIIGPFHPESDPGHAALAQSLGTDGVEFTGGIANDLPLRRLIAESEVMLLPYADGASERRTTLHVAWAFGLPVLTTPPPTANDAVIDGVNCLLVREPTAEAWAAAIRRVRSDPELSDRLRRGSLAAADRFSWARLAGLHLGLYESLLGSSGRGNVATSPGAG